MFYQDSFIQHKFNMMYIMLSSIDVIYVNHICISQHIKICVNLMKNRCIKFCSQNYLYLYDKNIIDCY